MTTWMTNLRRNYENTECDLNWIRGPSLMRCLRLSNTLLGESGQHEETGDTRIILIFLATFSRSTNF